MILAGAGPAFGVDGDQLVVTSTGLTDGQAVGPRLRFSPVWSGGAGITEVSVYVNDGLGYTTTNWAGGLVVPMSAAVDDEG